MICPQDINKQYMIPTKKWLKPIEKYIIDDINTSGLIMIGKMLNKEEVIVKITKGNRNDIIDTNKIIKDLPNFVETYCSFSCLEDYNSIKDNYKDSKEFCNSNDDNRIITLEIMKKYKYGSLFRYKDQFGIKQVVDIMKQLFLAQIHAFSNENFLHNDTHLGNFLIEKRKDKITINYSFQTDRVDKSETNIKTNIIYLLSDFNDSYIYKNDNNLSLKDTKKDYTLRRNIYKTFNECLLLLKEKYYIEIRKNIIKNQEEIVNQLMLSSKNLRSYYKKYYKYDFFNKKECTMSFAFSILLINLLDENECSEWIDV